MKRMISLSVGLVMMLAACTPAADTNSPGSVVENRTVSASEDSCPDLTGIWLGEVTDDLQGVAFSNPWGLILEQEGCGVTGRLANNLDGPRITCEIEGNTLTCQYFAGEECSNDILLEIGDGQLTGKLNSCISTESDVVLEMGNERELRELFENSSPAAFPANPHPDGCWLHSLYVEGFITVFCEKFDDNSNNWPVGGGSGSLALTGTAIENGVLILDVSGFTADGQESAVLHFLPPMKYAEDYLFQAAGKINSSSVQAAWGLAFEGEYSGSSQSKYIFMISNSGQYSLIRFEDSRFVPLVPPKDNESINMDSGNTITIIKQGSSFDFYINGTVVESLELQPLADTGLMLSVSVAAGVDAEFEFDNLLIRSPGSQE